MDEGMLPCGGVVRSTTAASAAIQSGATQAGDEIPATSKLFRFRFNQPAPRPLKKYLVDRYRYGRSDAWLRTFYPGRITLDGEPVDETTQVHPGQEIAYRHDRSDEPLPAGEPAILYEDEWMVVVLKPDSLPVNPSGVFYFTCLAVWMRELLGNDELTPIHRLDLETSGALVLARRKADLPLFHRLFVTKTIRKTYRALVHGHFPAERHAIAGTIVPDSGSAIKTRFRLKPGSASESGKGYSLTRVRAAALHGSVGGRPMSELLLEPVTGKTNQLRVHMAALGHPIVGDKKYHPDERVFLDWFEHRDFERLRDKLLLPRQALHASALSFPHPITGEMVRIAAPENSWRRKVNGLIEPSQWLTRQAHGAQEFKNYELK